ncbi:MAG: hypothetical protein AAFY76_19355, partial [Cyanobacteria bacterium J06649_11]
RIQRGRTVRVLYPDYVAGETGTVLEQETLNNGIQTGYWLVQLKGSDSVFALSTCEMQVLD